jgi:hypothetical protein
MWWKTNFTKKTKNKYCCKNFQESVKEKIFVHSSDKDETEWFMPEWFHIYYCPFCGAFIKGTGTGEYFKESSRSVEKAKRP